VSELDHNLLQRLGKVRAPNCPPLARLGDFLDEKLASDDRHVIELHLQACPSCLNRLIELRELALLQKEGGVVPEAATRRVKELGGRSVIESPDS
jgi:anti-sigma factor RsiW